MVYQIAAAYKLDLRSPERKLEVLMAFGTALVGDKAINAGINWLQFGNPLSIVFKAGSKALMIWAIGNTACKLYDYKVERQINPLESGTAFHLLREESQAELGDDYSEEAVATRITIEIEQAQVALPEAEIVCDSISMNVSNSRSASDTISTSDSISSNNLSETRANPPNSNTEIDNQVAYIQNIGCSHRLCDLISLAQYSYHPHSFVRREVAAAMGAIASNQTVRSEILNIIPILGKLSQDSDSQVRQVAVQSLGQIKSPQVIPYIQAALRDSDSEVVLTASKTMNDLKTYRLPQSKTVKTSKPKPKQT
ncbi:MAG: HEAT repeat domain-containing protein [Jaaginema sp. PMC 1078.18]|nr:HEAT repeat domain-containing protein [Jaaginema sp. PMC 1078.18]